MRGHGGGVAVALLPHQLLPVLGVQCSTWYVFPGIASVCSISLTYSMFIPQTGNGTVGTDVRVRNNKLHCQNCYSNDEGMFADVLHSDHQPNCSFFPSRQLASSSVACNCPQSRYFNLLIMSVFLFTRICILTTLTHFLYLMFNKSNVYSNTFHALVSVDEDCDCGWQWQWLRQNKSQGVPRGF